MKKEKRIPSRPVKLTIKSNGVGLTSPRAGIHFIAGNQRRSVGVAEGQLKYWIFEGRKIKEVPFYFDVTDKDIEIEAFFGEPKPKLSLGNAATLVEKDIKATSHLNVKHAKKDIKDKTISDSLLKTEEEEI